MSKGTFDVVMLGNSTASLDAAVITNLCKLFKTDEPTIKRILKKPKHVVKKEVVKETAEKYKQAIERAGVKCELVEITSVSAGDQSRSALLSEPQSIANQPGIINSEKQSMPERESEPFTVDSNDRINIVPKTIENTSANANEMASVNSVYQAPSTQVEPQTFVYCRECGTKLPETAEECPNCRAKQVLTSPKNKVTAGFLALFIGGLGIHRFYLGQWWGIFYLLFWSTLIPSIISLIESIVFFLTPYDRWNQKYGKVPAKNSGVIAAVIAGVILMVMVIGILAAVAIPAYSDYKTRAKVQSAMPLILDTQQKVTEFIRRTGFYPNQNLDAGLPEEIKNDVAQIKVEENSKLVVIYSIEQLGNNNTIVWTPAEVNGEIAWDCLEGKMIDRFRPKECRSRQTKASQSAELNKKRLKTFKSSLGPASIEVPETWRRMDQLNDAASIGCGSLRGNAFALVIEELKEDFEEGFSVEDYSSLIFSSMQENITSPSFISEDDISIDKLDAKQVIFSGVSTGIKVTFILTSIESKTHFYQVLTWTNTSKYTEQKEILKSIALSFKESR